MSDHATAVERGERFEFGANWARFLALLNAERIEEAKASLRHMLNVESLEGRTFLDVGSGSGLFSLAARLLGAKVHSFDYDPQSVACTSELKQRYFPNDPSWLVESGSVLDNAFLARLGQFDVVYSWGVLHHTGQMWTALENVIPLIRDNGHLFIAIYNKQRFFSAYWKQVKKGYNKSPSVARRLIEYVYASVFVAGHYTVDLSRGRDPRARHRGIGTRGMSVYHDVVDWIGGWPFEVASADEVCAFFRGRGFQVTYLVTCGRKHGCNEFVFLRTASDDAVVDSSRERSTARSLK